MDEKSMTSVSVVEEKSAPETEGKRKRVRREEIIAEASRLFAERGYEGTSMGDLAERVGLRKASLFHHFPSKDGLYVTVLSQLLDEIREAIVTALRTCGSFAERLDALTDTVTCMLSSHPHAARLVIREAMDATPATRDNVRTHMDDVLIASLEFVRAGQRGGAFNPDVDAEQLVISLLGVFWLPFSVGDLLERFTGDSPFQSVFLERRRTAIREQVRALVLAKKV